MKRKVNKDLSGLDSNGYYNKTIHTCILKLHIPLEIINDIYKNLYHKNEVSGVFYCDDHDQVTHIDKNEGDTGSVYTPNNVLNYHTHPIHAYKNGKTAFGSPSGEDYRECLKFALNGNKAHLVYTVEGLYTIQVSPCKIKKMKELLDDVERGVLIFLIEEYFKTLHDFRCIDELNDLASRDIHINPYSYIDFANTFDIPNLLCNTKNIHKKPHVLPIHKTGHTSIHSESNIKLYSQINRHSTFCKIPNVGFPCITDDYITTKPLKSYITKDDLENLRNIDNMGKESDASTISIHEIEKIIKNIATKFDSAPCLIEWNSNPNAWFFVNFFPTKYYQTNCLKKYTVPDKNADTSISHEPFIRIFSNKGTGCKITDIAKYHNFNMNKQFHFGVVKESHCPCHFGQCNHLIQLNKEISYLTNRTSIRHT